MIVELLSNTGYIMYNKKLALLLGVHEAILIGELCAKYHYWFEHGELLQNDGWFYLTREEIEKDTGLSAKQQRVPLQNLKDRELIDYKLQGVPAKLFYTLNSENLRNLLCQKVTTGDAQTSQQAVPKGHDTYMYNKKDTKKENDIGNTREKKIYGEFGKVRLTGEEYDKLVQRLGKDETESSITRLDSYIASKGTKYVSHYATLLNWWRKDHPDGKDKRGHDKPSSPAWDKGGLVL